MSAILSMSLWIKLATAIMVFAFALLMAGFSTQHWCKTSMSHIGLWDGMVQSRPYQEWSQYTDKTCMSLLIEKPGWFQAVRVLETFGVILVTVAFLLILLYGCLTYLYGKRNFIILVSVCSFFGVFSTLLGGAIFIVKMEDNENHSWSFVCSMISAGLAFIGGFLSALEAKSL